MSPDCSLASDGDEDEVDDEPPFPSPNALEGKASKSATSTPVNNATNEFLFATISSVSLKAT